MLGKRSSSMRRTVSMATLNQGSAPLDHPSQQDRPREKQKQKSVPHTHGFSSDSRNQSAGHGCRGGGDGCRGDGPMSEHAGRAVKEGVGLGIVAAMHNPEVCSVQMVLKEVWQSPNFGEPLLSTSVIRKAVQQPSQQSVAKFRHPIVEESIVKKEVLTPGTSDAIPSLLFEVHFLETCFYCKRTIRQGRDIYMYRGDKAFCSVDCRHRQILADEHKEKCMLATFKTRSSGTNTKITAAAG